MGDGEARSGFTRACFVSSSFVSQSAQRVGARVALRQAQSNAAQKVAANQKQDSEGQDSVAGTFHKLFPVSELPAGEKKPVEIEGKSVLVCHGRDGRMFAVSNICSHDTEKLECGRMSRGWIACPVHGARFDLATGAPLNPPATLPIATYEIRVVEDWIEVAV